VVNFGRETRPSELSAKEARQTLVSLTHNPDLPQSATPLKAAYTIDIF
jgi:hypothetical protein